MKSQAATYDKEVTLPENEFTRIGYVFKHWTTKPGGGGFVYTDKQAFRYTHEDITLYAVWEAIPEQVIFEQGDGSGESYTQTIGYEETKALLKCTFTREGYTFAGWSTNEDAAAAVVEYEDEAEFTMNEMSVTLYAVWEANINTITFNGSGADDGEMSPQQIATDDIALLLPNTYSKSGYVFAGWSDLPDSDFVLYADEEAYLMGTEDVTLYAVWGQDIGTIVFDANAPHTGSMPNQTNEMHESFTLIPNEFERAGYYFDGWSTKPGGQAAYLDESEFILKQKTLVLYAVWKPETNIVIFDACGGEGEDFYMQILTDEVRALVPNSFYKPGHSFAGWSTVSGFEGSSNPEEAMVTQLPVKRNIDYADQAKYTALGGNVRLYAVWQANEYTVVFDSGYDVGQQYTQNARCYETFALTGCKFDRRGYTFSGWCTMEDGSADDVEYADKAQYTMGVENVTLYAKWTPNEYHVIYDANAPGVMGEMDADTYTYDVWSTLNPCEFERSGYTFVGWSKQSSSDSSVWPDGSEFMPEDQDIILFAQWQANLVEIKLYANTNDIVEEDPVVTQSAFVDSKVKLNPNTFDNPGYVFDGWSTEPVKYKPEDMFELDNDGIADDTVSDQDVNATVFYDEAIFEAEEDDDPLAFLSSGREVVFDNRDEIIVPVGDVVLYAKWKVDENYIKSVIPAAELQEDEEVVVDEKTEDAGPPELEENEIDLIPTDSVESDLSVNPAAPVETKKETVTVKFYYNGSQKGDAITKDKGTAYSKFTKPAVSGVPSFTWCEKKAQAGKTTVYTKLESTAKINRSMDVVACYAVKFYYKGELKKTTYTPVNSKFSGVNDRANLKVKDYNWSLKGKRTVKSKVNGKTKEKTYTSYDIMDSSTEIKSNTNLYATYKLTFKGKLLDYKQTDAQNKAKKNAVIDIINVPCGKTPTFAPVSKNYKGYNFIGYRVAKINPKTGKQKRVTKTVNGKKTTSRVWNEFNSKKVVNKPITYYANYEHIKVTITLKYGYDGIEKTRTYNYGYIFSNDTLTPKRKHYDFVGWKDRTGKVITSFEVTKKRTLYADWKGKFYTVTFETDTLSDGTVTPKMSKDTIRIQYPNTFKPQKYKLANISGKYNFQGWSGTKGGSKTLEEFVVTRNKTVYPVYNAQTYYINLHGNYGKAYVCPQGTSAYMTKHVNPCKYWDTIKLSNDFVRTGSTFQGWRTSEPESMKQSNEYFYIDKGGSSYDTYVNSAQYKNGAKFQLKTPGDKDFYAVWKQNDINVFYYVKTNASSSYIQCAVKPIMAGKKFTPAVHPGSQLNAFFSYWECSQNVMQYKPGNEYRMFLKTNDLCAKYNNTVEWELNSRVNSDKIKFTKYLDGSCYAQVILPRETGVSSRGYYITDSTRRLVDNPQKSEYGLNQSALSYFTGAKEVFDSYYKNGKIFTSISVGSDEYYAIVLDTIRAAEDSTVFWANVFKRSAHVWALISIVFYSKQTAAGVDIRSAENGNILSNKTLTNQTGKVDNYISATKGNAAAQSDFNAMNPSNVRTYPNGTTVGNLPNGTTINMHPSSTLSGTPTLEIYYPTTGTSIKIRY